MLDKAWIVQDPATNKPAGFTGWQFRDGEKGKQAFYAVGILPEFRRQGLAKKALKQMFEKHTPADVAEIKAFVVPDNKPSLGLARDLGVKVQHKSSGLLSLQPACNLTKMSRSKYIPNSYGGVSLQQFMPIASRRTQLTPQEAQAVEDGSSQWLPRIFTSMADSPADDMHSPGKGALMAGLAGLAAGAGGAHLVGADQKWQAGAGAGAGLVGALLAYNAIKAKNEGIQEMMRRIPPNGTRRDMLADPVLQADLERASRTGSSEEALRTAQLLAVLQATKQAGQKRAGFWSGVGKVLRHPHTQAVGAGTAGSALWDQAAHNFDNSHWTSGRALNALMNAGLLGWAASRGGPPSQLGGRMGVAMSVPVKDLAVSGTTLINNLNASVPGMQAALHQAGIPATTPSNGAPTTAPNVTINSPSSLDQIGKFITDKPLAAAGIGAAGVGLTAAGVLGLREALRTLQHKTENEEQGRIKVTLPTRKPGDAETTIDIPTRQIGMSDSLFGRIRRDALRRLQAESKERTRKINLSPEERARRAAVLATYR